MMKKQFFRVKQLVDQTVSRAEKSEAFTEDVQSAEKHVDLLKLSCTNTAKKICGLMSGNEGLAEEKRAKKMPETVLGHSMMESAVPLGEKSILKDLLTDCGGIEIQLGHMLMQYEIEVEKLVLQPLNQVEVEASNIAKARRALNKLILDMDSAKARYQTAQRQANSGGNVTKIDGIKEEMEEALIKVDQSRDALAADIYTLLAKESEYAKLILQFAQSQRNYHKAALDVLDKYIPLLEEKWRDHVQKPVFGTNLEEHLAVTDRNIALPIEVCVCALYETGMNEEGLFRIAGGASKVRKFRAALDSSNADLAFALELHDVHIVAGTLKSYLRELPDPLFSHDLYEDWVNSVKSSDAESRLHALRETINRLPEKRRANIRYLIKFFHELSRHQEHNKMTPQNLAIVLAPSLIWSPANGGDVFGLSALANTHASIIEHLISHADWFFPGEIEYFINFSRVTPATPSPSHYNNTNYMPINGDRWEEHHHRDEDKGHRRVGSYEGVFDYRNAQSTGTSSENSSSKVESPRPTSRKKNKPAPIPPGQGTPGGIGTISRNTVAVKTPDKEDKKLVPGDVPACLAPESRSHGSEKPSLPPTGPDTRRLSTLEKRPILAPRLSHNPNAERSPSQSTHPHPQIGFETIEGELKSRMAKQGRAEQAAQHAPSAPPAAQKSDDEVHSEPTRRVPQNVNKKLSSGESAQQSSPNPTHHPNAVPVFGFAPIPTERSKFDSTDGKARPSVPDRPSNVRIQGASQAVNTSQDQSPSSERRGSYPPVLERIQSFSVNKQQVSIIQVNSSTAPLSLNSSDHPDIQYADSEDIPSTNASQSRPLQVHPPSVDAETSLSTSADVSFTACSPSAASVSGSTAGESAAKPERPPKPERLSHPSQLIESNNNKSESEEETTSIVVAPPAPSSLTPSHSSSGGTLPRPTPRPQPPIPPVKPRNASAGSYGSSGNVAESTDF